jgi:manganese/zinc/iron transport system ATP- binding protein
MPQRNLQLVNDQQQPDAYAPKAQQVAAASAISVSNATVSYDGRPVLRSVSFNIAPNQMVGIIGPNGAGKSTLMKAILGLVPLNSGKIGFFGESINACRDRIAYVPQTEAVDWDFPVTVLDVVMMGRARRMAFKLWPGKSDRQHARHALDLVDMTDFQDRHIRQLSGGQQQRVFLARALCQEADILLLDEPFAGVDAATEKAIFALIAELTKQGKTLLVINHDLNVLNQFDQLLLLNQHVIAFGPTQQVGTDENLKKTYGGRLSLLEQADESLRRQRGSKL